MRPGHNDKWEVMLVRSFKHLYDVISPQAVRQNVATVQLGGDWTVAKEKAEVTQDRFDPEQRPLVERVDWTVIFNFKQMYVKGV